MYTQRVLSAATRRGVFLFAGLGLLCASVNACGDESPSESTGDKTSASAGGQGGMLPGSGGSNTAVGQGGQGGLGGLAGSGGQGGDAHPCDADECYIDTQCVVAGTPKSDDPCQACLPTVAASGWSADADNVTCNSDPYWQGVARDVATTPYGHDVPISCHNCYVNSVSSLSETLAVIDAAIADGADLIELDIKYENNVVYVDHNDDGDTDGATLGEVLADTDLMAADQLLFIEFKETAPSEAFIKSVLDSLKSGSTYAKSGRPAVLRAFSAVSDNLTIARRLLASSEYVTLRPHVRLQELMSNADGGDITGFQNKIIAAKNKGFHGVEFQFQTSNLLAGLGYARSLGLGTSAYTIPNYLGEVYLAALRDELDSLTTDYDLSKARTVVEDENTLIYLNAWGQNAAGAQIQAYGASKQQTSHDINVANAPSGVTLAGGQALFGTALEFDASSDQLLSFYDADNQASDGYMVMVGVQFDQPIPADGETSVLFGKADASSFSLELRNPSGGGSGDAVLRFGVYVSGEYRYATYPASNLSINQSYLVMGAYDGDGKVWVWVNNSESNTTQAGPYTAGVAQNDSTALLGADPQGTSAPRYYFDGRIQLAVLQAWANH